MSSGIKEMISRQKKTIRLPAFIDYAYLTILLLPFTWASCDNN